MALDDVGTAGSGGYEGWNGSQWVLGYDLGYLVEWRLVCIVLSAVVSNYYIIMALDIRCDCAT